MPLFPSKEWCEALITALNADAEAPQAAAGWRGDLAAAVLAEPGHLAEDFVGYCRPDGGRIRDFRMLEDLDEIEEIEPAYRARASYSVWKQLILGTLDPVEALVKRKVEFHGDLEPLIARAQFKDLLRRALAKVPTTFADAAR